MLEHVHNSEIEVRAQASIQAHFCVAISPPLRDGREVQEPEIDRFAELVDECSGQDDPRDVGFNQPQVCDRMRIGLWPQQVHNPRREIGKGRT